MMLRGFRWQFLALMLAGIVFAFAAVFRFSRTQPAPPTSQDQRPTLPAPGTQEVAAATAAPAADSAASPVSATAIARVNIPERGIYREGLVGTVQRLNPLFAHLNPVDQDIASLIFRGLFSSNNYGAPVLDLAQSLTISSDGLQYALELRQGIQWQDGSDFSADDVLYTMSLLADPDYERFSPSAAFWRTVETQKLGERLLRFRLAQPLASFTQHLTIGILPEHALRGASVTDLAAHPFNLSPIGAGAYQLSELRAGPSGQINAVLLQLSPLYKSTDAAQASHHLRELRFALYANAHDALQAYRRGDVDALANIAPRAELLSLPGARLYTSLEPSVQMLIFNWNNPVFTDRRMRRALALSLNPADWLAPGQAHYADSPLMPGMSVYQPNSFWSARDPALASSLLDALDRADAADENGVPDSFTLLAEATDSQMELAQKIAAEWRALGLTIEVETVDAGKLLERLRAGEFDAAIVSQRIGGDPDVYRHWHPAQAVKGQNYGSAAEPEVAALLDSARRETNGITRQQLYQQFQAIFAEKAVGIPLYYPLYTMVARDTLEGIRLGYLGRASDRFRGISAWKFAATTS